eukprot:gene9749-13116_t
MSTAIGRNGKYLLHNTPLSPSVERVQKISKKNYLIDDDEDEEELGDDEKQRYNSNEYQGSQYQTINFSNLNSHDNNNDKSYSANRMYSHKDLIHHASSDSLDNLTLSLSEKKQSNINLHGKSFRNNNNAKNKNSDSTDNLYSTAANSFSGGFSMATTASNSSKEYSSTNHDQNKIIKNENSIVDREKQDLLDALELMKTQNKMLTHRIEKTHLESQQQIQQERNEKEKIISKLEQEKLLLHQELLNTQNQTEQKLLNERNEFFKIMKKLEEEKELLTEKVNETMEQADVEAGLLDFQRAEYQQKVELFEKEKLELANRMDEIEKRSQDMMNKVAINHLKDEKKIENIDFLEKERYQLRIRLEQMENEKETLFKSLVEVEKMTKEHAIQLAEQLENEKQMMLQSVNKLEEEKKLLSDRIKDDEKSLLLQKLEMMEKEKELLKSKLIENESITKVKENLLMAQMQREKEDLLKLVKKMKVDMLAERQQKNASLSTHSNNNNMINNITSSSSSFRSNASINSNNSISSTHLKLSNQKSLFECLGESNHNSSGAGMYEIISTGSNNLNTSNNDFNNNNNGIKEKSGKSSRLSSMLARKSMNKMTSQHTAVEKIVEGDESFMDLDDSEDWSDANGANKPSKEQEADDSPTDDLLSDLPTPHSAAALGDMQRLRLLESMDSNLLNSLDSIGRKPLFYAAAYGQEEILRYLIQLYPHQLYDGDKHGDTALHAAASSGHDLCCELIILAAIKYNNNMTDNNSNNNNKNNFPDSLTEPQNEIGMTPAHLASTPEVLEILYKYDANLIPMDNTNRSPLFVACALNREACAEFLIGCLDLTETSLLIQDHRGDTPLHAAACNDSMECLILLLQYGIDPRMTNNEGLKAIDLAVRNGHMKCRDALAEYHLHYCTSSEFDSVLFLATLEGHKHLSNFKDDKSRPISATNNPKSLTTKPSMFSLNTKKSLKLERIGQWIAYHDHDFQLANGKTKKKIYYYNHSKNIGQWDTPDEVLHIQSAGNKKLFDGYDKVLTAKMSMRLNRIPNTKWITYVTEHGKTFYYNESTGDFQWENPVVDTIIINNSQNNTINHDNNNNIGESKGDQKQYCGDWVPYVDPDSGCTFWYNHVTNVSQWESPIEELQSLQLQQNKTNIMASNSDNSAIDSSVMKYNNDSTSNRSNEDSSNNQSKLKKNDMKKQFVRRQLVEEDEEIIQVMHDNDLGI